MSSRPRGLYEVLITEALAASLAHLAADHHALRAELRDAEAADRIALHVTTVLRRILAGLPERGRAAAGIRFARALLERIEQLHADAEVAAELPIEPGAVLRAIAAVLPDGTPEHMPEPLIPLLDTALLTNAPGEPRVGSQVLAEIGSADRIDLVMAFIRRSGLRPLLPALRAHCQHGRSLRVLTTTYTGSTELEALQELQRAGAEVRVSYETGSTRLHAKAWLFHRASGFATAYIGSSNLTHTAQVTGLEWNVRASAARNPDVVDKVRAVFESYWSGGDFVAFEPEQFRQLVAAPPQASGETLLLLDLRPEPFQERLLEQIEVARAQGHHRNLLVSATGTGKTVMAAIFYARLAAAQPRARLLFVAHRQEILTQSRTLFRHALHDQAFGELWVGGERPRAFEHVFASIQSLHASGLEHLHPEHFDIVIVDEFHHAAAPSYRALLEHVQPQELLGLTATPERSDGLPVLTWFDDRIAAELRLWDAIAQHRLCPFAYYGVHDGTDLRQIPWRRGRGYDVEALANVLTGNDLWAALVVRQLRAHVDDPGAMRALGFCVSVEHARFMARVFQQAGIAAVAVWASSSESERQGALADLAAGRVNVLFSVDLFNEGVDLPVVDTLLFLRPTDSPTLFLQQLGRGLRRSRGKTTCTVLDFVGQHRHEFRFDRRFRALLGGTRGDLQRQIEQGFPFLPAGCHMQLDAVAAQVVLDNIRRSIPERWRAKVEELRALAQAQAGPTLARYLEHAGLEPEDLYTGNRTWSDLLQAAGLPVLPAGPHEAALRRGCGRLLHVDDGTRLEAWQRLLHFDRPPAVADLPAQQQRLLRMLIGQIADQVVTRQTTLQAGVDLLWTHPQVRAELLALLPVLGGRIDHLHRPVPGRPDLPLAVHARYSRIEILAACGIGDGAAVAPWQTGVYWHQASSTDLFAFTLDKTSGQFSPTTRYRDYAISRERIHWQSQSTTRADSDTGRRYQRHAAMGTTVLLFARLRRDERAFWCLGPAHYESHESEQPMSVVWRLDVPLPADLFAAFAAAVA